MLTMFIIGLVAFAAVTAFTYLTDAATTRLSFNDYRVAMAAAGPVPVEEVKAEQIDYAAFRSAMNGVGPVEMEPTERLDFAAFEAAMAAAGPVPEEATRKPVVSYKAYRQAMDS